jgi:WD40 repeat protein
VGLRAFEADEWDRFFARSTWTKIVIANVVASRLTLLYGESGVGKTSLLQAGVEHELSESAANGGGGRGRSRLVPVVFRTWQGDPVVPLIARVWQASGSGGAPPETLLEALRSVAQERSCRVVLILDQFEEYLLYHGDHEGRDSLPAQLAPLLEEPRLAAAVLISIREDALSRLDSFKRAIPRLYDNLLHLERVDRASATEAITGPIDWYNRQGIHGEPVEIEPPLVERILGISAAGNGDAAGGATVEFAYLQLILERLWAEAQEHGTARLGLDLLERVPGGADEIVRDHVRRAVDELADEDRDLAAEVFRYLVTPSGAKIAYTVSDLAGLTAADPDRLERLVGVLSAQDTRILRPVGVLGSRGVESGVEIYHDKLAGPILAWRAEHLEQRAREHARAEERERAQLEKEEAERERKRRLRRIGLIAGLAALLILLFLGVQLLLQLNRNNELERSSRLANASAVQLDRDPELSVLLAKEAVEEDAREATVEALRAALVESRVRRVLPPAGRRPDLNSMALAPDDRTLVTGSNDGSVRIWDVATGELRAGPIPGPLKRAVSDLEISRFGDRFLTTVGATVDVRSLSDGELIDRVRAPGAQSAVDDADFNKDGTRVALAYLDGALLTWRSRPGDDPVTELGSVRKKATSVAISPDGRRVIATGEHEAKVFETGPSRKRGRRLVPSAVATASFSRDGEHVALVGLDGSVWLWDGKRGRRPRRLGRHAAAVNQVSFDSSGELVATGSMDQTARVWDVDSGRLLSVLGGHTSGLRGLAFSRDGRRLATTSIDGTVRLWLSTSGRQILVLRGHTGPVQRVFFAANGLVASLSRNERRARVWEIDPGRTAVADPSLEPDEPARPVSSAESAEGDVKAVAKDNTVRVSKLSTGTALATPAHVGVRHLAFSPDGLALVTSGHDSARVWDARTGRALAVLGEGANAVLSSTFSPDPQGRFVLDVSDDGCARLWLWGVGGGALAGRFPREGCDPDRAIRAARFDSSGGELIFTDDRGEVSTYECEVCGGADELLALASRRVTRELTPAEKETFGVED